MKETNEKEKSEFQVKILQLELSLAAKTETINQQAETVCFIIYSMIK